MTDMHMRARVRVVCVLNLLTLGPLGLTDLFYHLPSPHTPISFPNLILSAM